VEDATNVHVPQAFTYFGRAPHVNEKRKSEVCDTSCRIRQQIIENIEP
jgi:hypothetical protein